MIGRLRLWSAYVLFAYVTTHLLNHALGLISLRVIEGGRIWFVYLWQSLPGQVALYGALLIHFTLALWAIVRRRSFRLSPWEWTQLVLGSSIVPLAALHVVATRVAYDYYGVESGYPWVLASLATSSWAGVARQFALPLVATGCRRSMPSPCWCRRPASPAPASLCATSPIWQHSSRTSSARSSRG